MSIVPINGIPAVTDIGRTAGSAAAGAGEPAGGFADSIVDALKTASAAEREADAIAMDIATGGEREVHELMIAMSKASLSVDLLVQVRNRATEAYQEVMRMQI